MIYILKSSLLLDDTVLNKLNHFNTASFWESPLKGRSHDLLPTEENALILFLLPTMFTNVKEMHASLNARSNGRLMAYLITKYDTSHYSIITK